MLQYLLSVVVNVVVVVVVLLTTVDLQFVPIVVCQRLDFRFKMLFQILKNRNKGEETVK